MRTVDLRRGVWTAFLAECEDARAADWRKRDAAGEAASEFAPMEMENAAEATHSAANLKYFCTFPLKLIRPGDPPTARISPAGDQFIIYFREAASSKVRGKEAKQPTLAAGGTGRRGDRANY